MIKSDRPTINGAMKAADFGPKDQLEITLKPVGAGLSYNKKIMINLGERSTTKIVI